MHASTRKAHLEIDDAQAVQIHLFIVERPRPNKQQLHTESLKPYDVNAYARRDSSGAR